MDLAELLDELVNFGQHDWIALWMIVDDIESELNPDDHEEALELTLALVEGLLDRGLLAGDSPVKSTATFNAWSSQQPSFVTEHIRRQWRERSGPPDWGDSPWFAMPARARRSA
jgi:hypothetical protein